MVVHRPISIVLLVGMIAYSILALPLLTAVIAAPQAAGQLTSSASEVHSDFNGDGYEDLAIGAPGEEIAGVTAAGGVSVLYGSDSGLQTQSPNDQFWHQNSPGVNDAAEEGDWFGRSLAAGDFNGDGFADLAIGAPQEDIGEIGTGAVSVLYGSASGLQTTSPVDQFWNQDTPGVEETAVGYDLFGYSLG